MNHSAWLLVLNALAVFRLTRLITRDTVTAPLREREIGVGGSILTPGVFLRCDWCVSVWMAAGVVALSDLLPHEWPYAAAALAFAAVAGLISERT